MRFDVVITTRKRPEMLTAAVNWCLGQGEALHKVIVAFDPDDDVTAALEHSLNDPRVVFLRLAERGGICGAAEGGLRGGKRRVDGAYRRRLGTASRAWQKLAEMASQASEDVVMSGARVQWTDGRETPLTVPDHPIDYVEQLEWRNRPDGIGVDNLCCLHRRVREAGVNWLPEPEGVPR